MIQLPTIDFILNYFVYFVPGLIGIKIFDYVTFSRIKLPFQELLFYSSLLTVVVYVIIFNIYDSLTVDSIIITSLILVGGSYGMGKIKRKFFQKSEIRPTAWKSFIDSSLGYYVHVRTTDGKDIFGAMYVSDIHADENYDIILQSAFIYREGEEEKLGDSIFIPKRSIFTITKLYE